MSALEDLLKGGNIVTALAIGIGAAVVAPVLRPVAKSLLKAGLIAYDQGRATLAELNEQTSDFVAEARSELAGGEHATEVEGGDGHPQQASDAVDEGRNTQSRPATRRTRGEK
jgi:hypothetical protein